MPYMSAIEVIFHGHSFFEIVLEQGSILVDPYITWNSQCDLILNDICKKNIIAICITHGHKDHTWDTIAIKKIDQNIPIYTVTWVAKYFTQCWLDMCIWWSIGGTLHHEYFSVKLVIAYHDWSIEETGLYTQPAWMIFKIWDTSIYHVWDSALTKDFELIWAYEKIDLLCIPIGWLYTMDIHDAVIACNMIKPRFVVPMHFDTFPAIRADAQEFARRVMLDNYAVAKVLKAWQMIVL